MIVWVSGPTGSGKSTLVDRLRKNGWNAIREEIKPSTMADFSKDPAKNCAKLQSEIMCSRYKQWIKEKRTSRVVFDRSIEEDLDVFCRLHRENGLLTSRELINLSEFADELQESIPKPDLIMFLTADLNLLKQRLVRLGHPRAIQDTLIRQSELYEDWVSKQVADVIKIDNSRCSSESASAILGNIKC